MQLADGKGWGGQRDCLTPVPQTLCTLTCFLDCRYRSSMTEKLLAQLGITSEDSEDFKTVRHNAGAEFPYCLLCGDAARIQQARGHAVTKLLHVCNGGCTRVLCVCSCTCNVFALHMSVHAHMCVQWWCCATRWLGQAVCPGGMELQHVRQCESESHSTCAQACIALCLCLLTSAAVCAVQMLLLMLVGMLLRSWRAVPYVGWLVGPVVSQHTPFTHHTYTYTYTYMRTQHKWCPAYNKNKEWPTTNSSQSVALRHSKEAAC